MTKDSIKEKFLATAIEHGKRITLGDHKTANKLHKKMQALYNKAKELNQVDLFSDLLVEPDENVRLWAATFSLTMLPDKAEKTLEDLSELTSIMGLSARTTMDLWKQGRLNLL